jgi:hypothetical protein
MPKITNADITKKNIQYFFTAFLIISLNSCWINSGKKPGSGLLPDPKKIKYSINLSEEYKVKEEGNKVFYKVPIRAAVEITANLNNQSTPVNWSMSSITGIISTEDQSVLKASESPTWKFANNKPLQLQVSARPTIQSTYVSTKVTSSKGNELSTTTKKEPAQIEDKIFVITWFVAEDQEEKNPSEEDLQIVCGVKSLNIISATSNPYQEQIVDLASLSLEIKLDFLSTCDKLIDIGKIKIFCTLNQETSQLQFEEVTYLSKGEKLGGNFTIKRSNIKGLKKEKEADEEKFFVTTPVKLILLDSDNNLIKGFDDFIKIPLTINQN